MFKHLLALLVDILFFLVGVAVMTLVFAAVTYFLGAGQNATRLTDLLRNQLDIISIIWYLLVVLLAYVYWVLIPSRYGYTIGMSWWRLTYSINQPLSLLIYNLLAVWWRVLLLPIWLYLLWKGRDIGSWLSGVTVSLDTQLKVARGIKWLRIVHILVIIILVGGYFFIRQVGFTEFIGRFIDYRTQIDLFVNQENWSEAQYALERYVHYEGEQPIATYYRCRIATGNRDWQTALTECEKAEKLELTNDEKLVTQYALAEVYQNTSEEPKALKIYEQLWKDNHREYTMIYYAQLLVESSKAKEGYAVVTEILEKASELTTEQRFVLERFQADLAAQGGEYDKSIGLYQSLLEQVRGNRIDFSRISAEKVGLEGEILFELAKAHYSKKDYTEAKKVFEEAKKKNPSYSDIIDSYLIDIELKSRK